MDWQAAGGPGARSALPDELACVGIVDPGFRARLGPRMDGRRVEQGGRKCAWPVRKGRRAVLPVGESRAREKMLAHRTPTAQARG